MAKTTNSEQIGKERGDQLATVQAASKSTVQVDELSKALKIGKTGGILPMYLKICLITYRIDQDSRKVTKTVGMVIFDNSI